MSRERQLWPPPLSLGGLRLLHPLVNPAILNRLLPGLVHVGRKPLILRPPGGVRWLRLMLPGRARLAVQRVHLVFTGAAASGHASASSTAVAGQGADAPLQDRPFRTRRELNPWWLLQFDEPQQIGEIRIFNLVGERQEDLYGLQCSIGDEAGAVHAAGNTDPAALIARWGAFERDVRRLRPLLAPRGEPRELRLVLDAFTDDIGRAITPGCSLASVGASPAALEARRQNLLARLPAVVRSAKGDRLREIVAAAAPVADALLDRIPHAAGESRAADCATLAIVLVDLLTRQPALGKNILNDYHVLLTRIEDIRLVEAEASRLQGALGLGEGAPLMFRSHGLSRISPRGDPAPHVAALKKAIECLAAAGYEAAICYGTFLGAVRTGEFIAHDDDMDMIMVARSTTEADLPAELHALARRLVSMGARVKIKGRLFLKLWPPGHPLEIDIFPILCRGERVAMHMERLRIRELATNKVLPFEPVMLHGEALPGPADPAGFLAERYGDTWRTPIVAAAQRHHEADAGGRQHDVAAPPTVRVSEPVVGPLSGAIETVVWRDFRVTITGWLESGERPGQPVRVALLAAGETIATTLAMPRRKMMRRAFALEAVLGSADAIPWLSVRADDLMLDVPPPVEPPLRDLPLIDERAPARRGEEVIGAVECVEAGRVTGWALVPARPSATVDLVLSCEGIPLARTRSRVPRGDIRRLHGGDGRSGFTFRLPSNLGIVAPAKLQVDVAVAAGALTDNVRDHPPRFAACLCSDRPYLQHVPRQAEIEAAAVSVIILNQNGAELLRALFASVIAYDADSAIEWIVIDHASADESVSVCQEAVAAGLDLTVIERAGNHSFSASNNLGAARARGEIVVFLNNDVVLTESVSSYLSTLLADPTVGMVGLKLVDPTPDGARSPEPTIQHLGVLLIPTLVDGAFRPFEARPVPELADAGGSSLVVPAVTGACIALRRSDFERVGGFDEGYFYGYEDIDLCLKVQVQLGKRVICCNDRSAVHARGTTRGGSQHGDPRRRDNAVLLNRKWGGLLRRQLRADTLRRPGFWHGHRPIIAFAVTEASDHSAAGDYFTALELGRALQDLLPVHIVFLGADEWYDLGDVDLLIAMVDRFDPRAIQAARPHLMLVAWVRNWFDRWCDGPGIDAFDEIWAASDRASEFMRERLGRPVATMRIAANHKTMTEAEPAPALAADYVFTGNRAGVARDIEFDLDPAKIDGIGAVYGHGWAGTPLAVLDRGPLPYLALASVYKATKLVIDDANVATKPWGSANSRLFDALAAGALVLTNGRIGAEELFGGRLPTWHNEAELTAAANYWLSHDDERRALVADLGAIVREQHSYAARARQVLDLIAARGGRLAIAIKSAVAEDAAPARFAAALARALRKAGHRVRIDALAQWQAALADTDDVVIVLRGACAYEPLPHQINLLWLLSHPGAVSAQEFDGYDHVFVASEAFAPAVAALTERPVSILLQCAETGLPALTQSPLDVPTSDLLFIGDADGGMRRGIAAAIEAGADLAVYGRGWDAMLPAPTLRGHAVPDEVRGALIARARWVLCDHAADMRRHGFIAASVFDALAAGADVLVDDVSGTNIFPDGVRVWRDADDLRSILRDGNPRDPEAKQATAAAIRTEHSFDARAATILDVIDCIANRAPAIVPVDPG